MIVYNFQERKKEKEIIEKLNGLVQILKDEGIRPKLKESSETSSKSYKKTTLEGLLANIYTSLIQY